MRRMSEGAFAKINLTLDVLGKRPDGYHEIESVMQAVNLRDMLTITLRNEPGIELRSNQWNLPKGPENLVYRAGELFLEEAGLKGKGLYIVLHKRIPMLAGLGGGSSDAAATLRCLNTMCGKIFSQERLLQLAAALGSDVPFCLLGGTALAKGRGERVKAVWPIPSCWILLCKPKLEISTPELFQRLDQLPPSRHPDTRAALLGLKHKSLLQLAAALGNVFEDVLPQEQWEEVIAIRRIMLEQGGLGACMSGTGPTVFGLFETKEQAQQAQQALRAHDHSVFLTHPVPASEQN